MYRCRFSCSKDCRMKALILGCLLVVSAIAEWKVSGEVELTGVTTLDAPTKASIHVTESPITTTGGVKACYTTNSTSTKIILSNRLDDTYIEHLSFTYKGRMGKHMYSTQVGTIDTFKGVFTSSEGATKQNPFIFKNHGIYNNEYLAGYLDTTVGFQQTYSYMAPYATLLTAKYSITQARELGEARAEGSIYGYNSKYVDLDYSTPIHSVDLQLEYRDNFKLFFNKAKIIIKFDATDNVPDDLMTTYLAERDPSIFVPKTPLDIDITRGGFMYRNTYAVYGYEAYKMYYENKDLNTEYSAVGQLHYLAAYPTDDFTPYISYGESTNSKAGSRKYTEKIAGFRYTYNDNVTLLCEWKKSSWIQHRSFAEHVAYLSTDKRHIEILSTRLILSF